MKKLITLLLVTATVVLTACVYQAAPGTYTTTSTSSVSKFDRSWSAAIGAFGDQNVQITSENRSSGVIKGSSNGINVIGNIRQQADGSVRVQFDTSGATSQDSGLIDRITQSYHRRMGR